MGEYGFKAQLKDVLSNAVTYFQDSGDPNAACVKAANEAGFNADQADRLVETFNTARVICHYKAAEDKTSACSLADKETVRSQLTTPVAEQKQAEYDTADYGCYKQAEVDYVVPEVKIAAAELKEEPLSKEATDWLAVREAQVIAECVKTAEEEARAANAMADELAEKAAMQISRNVSLDDIHDRMVRIVTAYSLDDRYAPGVEKVAEFLPDASDPDLGVLRKYAAMHVIDTSDLDDVMALIKDASDFAAESAALTAYADALHKEAQAAVDPTASLGDDQEELDRQLTKERIVNERVRRAVEAKKLQDDDQPAGGKGQSGAPHRQSEAPHRQSGSSSSWKNSKFMAYLVDTMRDQYGNALNKRVDKATDGINNLRRQLILQDLLVRDKVLSQEDPNAVAAAFRSINQASPDTTLNKEVLRSILRSAVQSVAISPYDVKTLADVDKARRQAYGRDNTAGNDNGGKK